MHPIEHLRHVARARGVAPAVLASEAATALGGLRADPSNLVVACRRIVERHPEVGQLWWLCAHLLVSAEPSRLAWELADRLADDPVGDVVAGELTDGATVVVAGNPSTITDPLAGRPDVRVWSLDSGYVGRDVVRQLDRIGADCEPSAFETVGSAIAVADVVVIEATAVSMNRLLAPVGSQVLAAVARAVGTPVWLVAGTGTRLPVPYVDEIARRVLNDDWAGTVDEVALDLVDRVVTQDGSTSGTPPTVRADCPFAPELLRSGGT